MADKTRRNFNTTLGLSSGHNLNPKTLFPRPRTGTKEAVGKFRAASVLQKELGNSCSKEGFYTGSKAAELRYQNGIQEMFPGAIPSEQDNEGLTSTGSKIVDVC